MVDYETLVCNSSASQIWIGFLFFLKFLLQAAAVIFAIRTRKVKIKALNDAKEISVIIYITSVVLTIMVIGVITLDNFRNADAAVFSLGLIVVSTIVLLLLFIPKVSSVSVCLSVCLCLSAYLCVSVCVSVR